MTKRLVAILGALLFSMIATHPGSSQESRATVLGRVTDSSGSIVPGTAIEITNLATGVSVKTETNGEGNYFSPFVIPGPYRIMAEKTGFKRAVRENITLNVNARL